MAIRRVGPYRLEGQLGAGGMGVVYAAWDERLERRVALKRIRPEMAGDVLRRERFRREARAVAQLEHPSIVRIHDLLETPEGDWLVLQYVEGSTLAELWHQGPLPAPRVVAVARDVLGALAAAHGRGLLHRDLKAENVMLAPSGRAMVLDFGLAKLYASGPGAPPAQPAAIATGTNGIVGTYRAMSPEQANGLSLDPRSDLFSLGVLLYEAATGVSPFQAETSVATLTRVCTHLQPPARELVPATPEPFSALIDAMLEKDPGRRPQSAGEALARIEAGSGTASADSEPTVSIVHRLPDPAPAAVGAAPAVASRASFSPYRGLHVRRLPVLLALAVLALLVVPGLYLAGRLGAPRVPLYVAVARPEIGLGAGREEVALAAAALQAAALRTLASLEGVRALAPGPPEPGEPRPSVGRLSRLLAAAEVVTASLDCQAHHCLAALRRQRGSDGTLLGSTASFEVPLGDLRLLETATATYLKPLYARFPARPEAAALEVRTADYQRYLRALRQWQEERPADLRPLLAELDRVQAGSPRFLDAYLLAASLVGRRFFQTRDPGDLEHALDVVAQARKLAPEDPLPLVTLFDIDLNAGRLAEAEAALHELERRQPGDAVTLQRRALLSEQRGDRRQALILLRAAAERHPAGSVLMDLANLEMRLGEIPAARSTLEKLLRRLPGDVGGETLLAQLELETGSPARAAALYAGLSGHHPGFAVLSNLGLSLLLLGRYGEAETSLARAYSLAPGAYAAALNLADVEFLLGRRNASSLYERVLDLVSRDPAPGTWQLLAARAQAEAHLGHRTEAADAIQRAVAAAPDNPDAAFDAALVYCVIGETASARASADRALSRGYDRRWFSLPWFDRLRQDPNFRQQVGEPSTGPIAGGTLPAAAGRPSAR